MERINRDTYRLSTGRTFYANVGAIGIRQPEDGEWTITEGYDGHVDIQSDWDEPPHWTPEERAELADYMIALWQQFKAASTSVATTK